MKNENFNKPALIESPTAAHSFTPISSAILTVTEETHSADVSSAHAILIPLTLTHHHTDHSDDFQDGDYKTKRSNSNNDNDLSVISKVASLPQFFPSSVIMTKKTAVLISVILATIVLVGGLTVAAYFSHSSGNNLATSGSNNISSATHLPLVSPTAKIPPPPPPPQLSTAMSTDISCNVSSEFQCLSGQCVAKDVRCDTFTNCEDKSDEAYCSNCEGFQCSATGQCLWSVHHKCNGIFDCTDLSDETNCSLLENHKMCNNGVQIHERHWCDRIDDCSDNSDETNCTCSSRQFLCRDDRNTSSKSYTGQCVASRYKCDGFVDCENGFDESDCNKCTNTQHTCHNYHCIPLSARCNGTVECEHSGDDEEGCFDIQGRYGETRVTHEGIDLPLCADMWTEMHSAGVCASIYSSGVQRWSRVPDMYSKVMPRLYHVLLNSSSGVDMDNFASSRVCKSNKNVKISCKQANCGEREKELYVSHIAGGRLSAPGKWPWVVSILFLGWPICGGALITKNWVVTAAHCILNPTGQDIYIQTSKDYWTSRPANFSVIAGSVDYLGQDEATGQTLPEAQLSKVIRIIFYPKTKETYIGSNLWDYDLVLLQIQTPMHFSPSVRPICLPSPNYSLPFNSICYMSGWGMLNIRQVIKPRKLRDMRINIYKESICRQYLTKSSEEYMNSSLCAGTYTSSQFACQGDSGGPLMCLDPHSHRWTLIGIQSKGRSECVKSYVGRGRVRNYRPDQYSRVSTFVPWIEGLMNS